MQLKNVLKGLVIVIPAMTMMACSSGPSEAELEAERNRVAAEQAEAERRAAEAEAAEAARVKMEAAEKMRLSEEQMMKEKSMLESEQTVYFDFDRSTVKNEYYSVLDKHAAFLVKNPNQSVVIEGHTDSRGTPEYNIALGERRAKAVQTYLQNAGVSSSQLSVVSYGEEKPADYGTSEYSFSQNRRGVVTYQ